MTTRNLYQKINEIQRKVKTVFKGARVSMGSGSYTAVSHDDVTSLLHDPIADVGIIAFPTMDSCEVETFVTDKGFTNYRVKVWASVTFINCDNPEEKITTKCFSYGLDSGDKATGKAYSMAIKYCYLKTFMLESMDEEESRDWENKNQDHRQYNDQRQPRQNVLSNPGSSSGALATPNQVNAVKKLYPDYDVTGLTKTKAGELISSFNNNKR